MEGLDDQDELSIATNWKRAFEKVYTEIKWLNAYAIINQIAAQKILKKFLKECFELDDNIIDKNLVHSLFLDYKFSARSNIGPCCSDIKTVYAKYFCKNNIKVASEKLDGSNSQISKSDLMFISMFGSASAVVFLFLIWYAILKPEYFKENLVWTGIEATGPVMRCTFIVVYTLFAVGLCISVFREREINYMHIFELDERVRVRQYSLWKMSAVLLFIWSLAFCFNVMEISLTSNSNSEPNTKHSDWISIVLILIFLILCTQPFLNCFQRKARGELLWTIFNISISPFGSVRFRDFFFADIITSVTHPLVDIGLTFAYFT